MVGSSNIGTWSQERQHLLLQVGDLAASFEIQGQNEQEVAHQLSGSLWENSNLSLAGISFHRLKLNKR
jgi:hypothetical protein